MGKDKYLAVLVEPEISGAIEQERGREPRSSFIRRILVRWYNSLPFVNQQLEE